MQGERVKFYIGYVYLFKVYKGNFIKHASDTIDLQ